MKLLISSINKAIVSIGENIESGVFPEADPSVELYKVVSSGSAEYFMQQDLEIVNVDKVPSEVERYKYCYTKEKGFYANSDYREPDLPTEDRVSNLEEYSADLLYQVCLLQLGTSDDDVSINK